MSLELQPPIDVRYFKGIPPSLPLSLIRLYGILQQSTRIANGIS